MPAMLETIKEVLHVRVVADDTKTLAPPPKEKVVITKSFQTSAVPSQILAHSPNRIMAEIYVQGVVGTNASVFFGASQSDVQNVQSGQINSGVATVQPGFKIQIPGTTDLWVSALAAQPPIVSVIEVIER